ncbi:MAG: DUF1360 domain-containing protein [Nocardioides sp.]
MKTTSRPASLRDYDPEGDVNLAGFTGSLGAFVVTAATAALVGRAKTKEQPQRFSMTDVLLGGLATHKVSRLLAKGAVTSPIRAWFTTFEGAAGSSEHRESPRDDHGFRHTVGELLTCPFCLAQWLALAYVAGLVVVPGPTRAGATVFAVTALSDSLQHVYEGLVRDA